MLWIISPFYLLQIVTELALIDCQGLDHTGLLHQVKGEQGQSCPGSCFSKVKDVKLPAALCFLHMQEMTKQ